MHAARRRPFLFRQSRAGVAVLVTLALAFAARAEQESPTAATPSAIGSDAAPGNAPLSSPNGDPAAKADALEQLVAPVALYPDALLVVVLQAATVPLEVVEADRFLDRRAKDPSLRPKPSWDSSVVGLLNYPTVLSRMSDELDWTQALGMAVLDNLVEVQAAIQQFRSEVQAAGALRSDDKQTVIVDREVIRIEPANPDVVYVPMYDPEKIAAAPVAPSAQPPVEAGAAPAPPVLQAAPAPVPIYPAPVYPAPVMYSDPYPPYWGPGATFLGGAVVGGLLGYALADDHHGGDFEGANITRGSNNTINIDRSRTEQAQAQLRNKSAERQAGRETDRTQRQADRPARSEAATARGAGSQPASALGDVKSNRATQLESQRGAQSRAAAAQQRGPAAAERSAQRPNQPRQTTPAVADRGGNGFERSGTSAGPGGRAQPSARSGGFGGGGGSAFSGVNSGGRSAQASQRGAASRGAGAARSGGGRRR